MKVARVFPQLASISATCCQNAQTAVGAGYESEKPYTYALMSDPKAVDGITGLADVSETGCGAPTPIGNLLSSGEFDALFELCLTYDPSH